MPLYKVTYTKKFKGVTEELSQDVEAKNPSDAKRQVMNPLTLEVKDFYNEQIDSYPKKEFVLETGTSVIGVWQGRMVPAQSPFSPEPYVYKKDKVILKYQGFKATVIE